MAAHPFTTIDPNTGYCFVPAPIGSCPEDSTMHPSAYGSTHGRSPDGRRFLPVFLKDVAGLVPGAYQGKGKGNQFLNDLTDATVLIHVLDASGTSDPGGNKIAIDDSLDDLLNPLDDLAWIRNELVEWIYSNLAAKWDGVQRRGRDRLGKLFSGYGQREAETQIILRELEEYLSSTYRREQALGNMRDWDQADIHLLVSTFLGVRFPMTLALNKCDISSSHAYIDAIQNSLPIHGAHHGTPMVAKQEMLFVRNSLAQSKLSIGQEKDSIMSPPINVWACLSSALSLREPVLVFPVIDMISYAPLPGLNRSASEDASLPSDCMVGCIEASGGVLPSCFDTKIGSYSVPNKDKSSQQKLRDVLIMKPGSTVEDVFLSLKKRGALSGEFVRAEAACNIGEKPRLIPKLEVMTRNNRIVKIMSNKRMAWQRE
jgi:ribosome-binding ATPase